MWDGTEKQDENNMWHNPFIYCNEAKKIGQSLNCTNQFSAKKM
jgi:hypothetical protein